MNELIEALLEFAHLGRKQLKPAQIDLEDALEEALRVLRPEAEIGRGATFSFTLLRASPLAVRKTTPADDEPADLPAS